MSVQGTVPGTSPAERTAWAVWSWIGRALTLAMAALAGAVALIYAVSVFVPPVARSTSNSVAVGVQLPEEVSLAALDQRSIVYAGDGSVLGVLHDDIDRQLVPLSQIPQHVRDAVITAEDRKFWEHEGYDVEGIGRALVANARAGVVTQGGSTITQQLAKSEVGDETSLERKLIELTYAVALEREFTKEQLLERYLNQVYFGNGAYGIAAAAEEYFGHDQPGKLLYEEAALLAGIIRSPGSLDPRRSPDAAVARRDRVIRDMGVEGYFTPEQVTHLVTAPLGITPPRAQERPDPFLLEAVKQEFYDSPMLTDFGEDRLARNERLLTGGLRVYTSVEPLMQVLAREVVTSYLPDDPTQPTASIAAVDPRDGSILAIYGGADFAAEQYNIATQGRRQPGSSFKPFVMATALMEGFPLDMELEGTSPAKFPGSGDPKWEEEGVQNYGGASYGRVDMRQALIRSVNTAFAQLGLIIGIENAVETARQMGINTDAATAGIVNPAISLGGIERGVTPLEMASAYGTFANGGAHVPASMIDRIESSDGEVLYQRTPAPQQVLDPRVNGAMVDVMQSVVSGGTATRASLANWRAAGKTGTTQNNADAWFVGYTPVMSAAVWMGHAEGQISMPGRTGGSIPATIWHDFMVRALDGVEPVGFPEVEIGERALVDGGEVSVPDVRGLDETQALRALAEAKLIGQTRIVDSLTAEGTVLWQNPRPGETAQAGDSISIGVSSGKAPPPPEPEPEPSPTATETPTDAPSTEAPSTEAPATEAPATEDPVEGVPGD